MTSPPAVPDPAAAAPGSRVVITRGGEPDAAELAALALALMPGAAAPTTADASPAWARAALLAGAGGPIAVRPSDLDAGRHRMR